MSRVETIGGAKLYLGDCREVMPTLERKGALVSDPPYGANAKLGMGGGAKGDGGMWKDRRIAGDKDVTVRDEALQMAGLPFAVLGKVSIPAPPETRATVVWDKGEHTGAGDLSIPWKPSFELVFIGGDGWSWSKRLGGVIRVNAIAGCVADRNDGKRFHPFEKPVELMLHFCERAPGQDILDPFMGSGSTGIAALRLGRSFIGIESDPEFFEIACGRIEDAVSRPELFAERWDVMWSRPFYETNPRAGAKKAAPSSPRQETECQPNNGFDSRDGGQSSEGRKCRYCDARYVGSWELEYHERKCASLTSAEPKL